MNLTEELKNSIEEFLADEEVMSFFEIKGYKPIIGNDNTVYLKNTKKKTLEIMEVKGDPNNKGRIRFKGSTWAFSINRNNKGKFYLDHLLIGNVKEEEFDFIFRHKKTKDGDNVIVKLIDQNKIKHIYIIKDNSIIIKRINKAPTIKYERPNFDFKSQLDIDTEDTVETFIFLRSEIGNPILLNKNKNEVNLTLREFLILEATYPSITNYIARIIPFINSCISECNNVRKQDIEVKEYEIRRKIATINDENASSFDQTPATASDGLEPVEPTKKYTLSRNGRNKFHLIEDKFKRQ